MIHFHPASRWTACRPWLLICMLAAGRLGAQDAPLPAVIPLPADAPANPLIFAPAEPAPTAVDSAASPVDLDALLNPSPAVAPPVVAATPPSIPAAAPVAPPPTVSPQSGAAAAAPSDGTPAPAQHPPYQTWSAGVANAPVAAVPAASTPEQPQAAVSAAPPPAPAAALPAKPAAPPPTLPAGSAPRVVYRVVGEGAAEARLDGTPAGPTAAALARGRVWQPPFEVNLCVADAIVRETGGACPICHQHLSSVQLANPDPQVCPVDGNFIQEPHYGMVMCKAFVFCTAECAPKMAGKPEIYLREAERRAAAVAAARQ